MLTIQKAKTVTVNPEPPPVEHSLSNVYIEGPHTVVHVSSSLTGMLGISSRDTQYICHGYSFFLYYIDMSYLIVLQGFYANAEVSITLVFCINVAKKLCNQLKFRIYIHINQ